MGTEDRRTRNATWLLVDMSFVWIVCTVAQNDNECLVEASLIEYAFGFRGAATLVLLLSVLINIELTYGGPLTPSVDGAMEAEREARAVELRAREEPTQPTTGNHVQAVEVVEAEVDQRQAKA